VAPGARACRAPPPPRPPPPPQELLNNTWTKKKWDGPLQYEDKSGTLMMLPTDMVREREGGAAAWVAVLGRASPRRSPIPAPSSLAGPHLGPQV